jgi:glycerol-1-phosphate dehydrogenase [NAD(P)+]
MDSAKRRAYEAGTPLILVPTALSTDAWANDVAAYRDADGVRYLSTGYADEVVFDADLLATAGRLNRWVLGDLLAVGGALVDWRRTDPAADSTQAHLVALADTIYRQSLAAAHAAPDWRTLAALVRAKVQLTDVIGSPVVEEGSEHFLAYRLEALSRRHHLHGVLVLFGLLVSGIAQDWDELPLSELVEALRALGAIDELRALLPLLPAALTGLRDYLVRFGYLNSVLLDSAWSPATVQNRVEGIL